MTQTQKHVRPRTWTGNFYLVMLAFFSGMAVMGVEMCAGRLMAPFFGTSMLIWTIIIGSTMIALAAGYYLGGVLAERHPKLSVLATLLFAAACFTIFLPYLAQPALELTLGRFVPAGADSGTPGGSGAGNAVLMGLIVCAVLISAPTVIFGMASPFLIRLAGAESSEVGRIAGKVFASSTLGSILGTFLPALVLVPRVGTRMSFLIFGGLLLVVTLWAVGRAKPVLVVIGSIILALGVLLGVRGPGSSPLAHLALEKETLYQHIRVFRVPVQSAAGTQTHAAVLVTDAGFGLQSMWTEGDSYTDTWQDLFTLAPRIYETVSGGRVPRRLLLIGLGGACAPYVISRSYPDLVIDGVEIDAGLIEAARPFFPFDQVKRLNVHVSDGRSFVRSSSLMYDVIIVDAFRPPHIPFHLATEEFFRELKARLADNGVLAMNTGSRGEERVFRGISNTIATVFPYVAYAQYVPVDEAPPLFNNRLILASDRDLKLNDWQVEDRVFAVPDGQWHRALARLRTGKGRGQNSAPYFRTVKYDPANAVFTDDSSALDLVSEREFLEVTLGRNR